MTVYRSLDFDPDNEALMRQLTKAELKALDDLRKLAKTWPQSLKIMSMGGRMSVVFPDDKRLDALNEPEGEYVERSDAVIADVYGIPNDGGDW